MVYKDFTKDRCRRNQVLFAGQKKSAEIFCGSYVLKIFFQLCILKLTDKMQLHIREFFLGHVDGEGRIREENQLVVFVPG